MLFHEYQAQSQYFRKDTATTTYAVLGLCEEAGEVAGKFAKWQRDNTDVNKLKEDVTKELGDVLWMVASIAHDMGVKLEDIASQNISKLTDRASRNVISGKGDNR